MRYTKQNIFEIEQDMLGLAGRDLGLLPEMSTEEHRIFAKLLRQYAKELRDSINEENHG